MKIKNFIKSHKEYFITSAIIFAIVFSFYALFGLFPFGKNSIAYYDMAAQTIPQSDLIFDYLKGRTSWFYSTSTGLGANTFGYLLYFILSPFNLLTLIGGEGNQFFTVNIVFALKLILIGCMAVWFIKKYFPNLKLTLVISLSLMYVFSGYMFFMWTYLSFLDYLIYAPLFVYFFNLLKDKGKIMPLSILIAFMILSCFSLGCFHLLYLVSLLIGYVFICVKKEDRRQLLMKLISACFIGIGLMMWLLFPAFIQYLCSGRGSLNLLIEGPTFYGTATRIATAITELTSVIFATLFLIKCDKKDKFNQFLIYASIVVLITIIFDEVMYMFNAGSLLGYYSRFGSSGALLTLTLACKYFSDIFIVNEDPKKYKFNIIANYTTSIGLMVIILIVGFAQIEELSTLFAGQFMAFLSLFTCLIIILIPLLSISFAFITKNMIGKKHFYNIVLIVTLFICCFNFPTQMYSAIYDTTGISNLESAVAVLDDDYRIKFFANTYDTFNASLVNVESINTFSSMVDNSVVNSLSYIGFPASANTAFSYGGTILSDLIVGNKYAVSPWEINKDYLRLLTCENGLYLYENIYFSDYITAFDSNIEFTEDISENQQILYEALGGKGKLFEKIDLNDLDFTYNNCTYNSESKSFTYTSGIDRPTITITNTFDNNTLLYMRVNHSDFNTFPIEVHDVRLASNCFIELSNTSSHTIKFAEELDLSNYEFYLLDLNKIANLNYNAYSLEKGKNSINSTINLESDSIVLIPFADISGYTVKVNGEETTFSDAFNGLMTLDLKAGENIIEIEFHNPLYQFVKKGFLIGIIFVLIGILVYRLRDDISDKFINYSFNGLSIAYMFVFILIPIIICFMKLLGII